MTLTLSDNQFSAAIKLLSSAPRYQKRIGIKEAFAAASRFFDKAEDSFDHGREVPTVIMVPGIACKSAVMKVLGEPLKEDFNVAYAPDFNAMGFADIRESALLLRGKIDEVLSEHSDDVYLVAHSLGSLVGVEALRTRNGVSKIVMLSPPFKGSPHADLFSSVSPACRQLSAGSGYLESLKSIEFGDHTEVYNYVAMDDVVVPIAAQFPHPNLADNLGVFIEHGYLHHDFIVGEKAREFAERLKGVLS